MSTKGIIPWFSRNHVAANLLMAFILVAGAFSVGRILIEVFPELDTDRVTVQVVYLGASPAEVEEGVCLRVEEAIASIEGIDRVRSVAQEGIGTITAELEQAADDRQVLDEIKAAVDRIDTFPAETEKPIISEGSSASQDLILVLYGDMPEKSLKALAEQVRDDLAALDEITLVEVAGIRRYEISIEVPEESLQRYGLTFDQVAEAVRRSSLDLPGGAVKTIGGEILLRTKGQRYHGAEFEDVIVRTQPDGTRLRLGDIATVIDGFEESDTSTRFNGKPAALIQVYTVGSERVLDVTNAAKAYLAELESQLPAGASAAIWQDDSQVLRQRIGLLLRNARLGLVLVFLGLTLFLNLRLAFWTTMGIPISFLGGLWLLPHFGISINMISLFAFIVALGIVVDDAIVVGENIYEYIQQGLEPHEAAIRGAREMAIPVTFAVLTTVAAFAPLLFVEGVMGQIMRNIPVVVIAVLAMSLVEALFILPAHLAARPSRIGRLLASWFSPWLFLVEQLRSAAQRGLAWIVHRPYRKTLETALQWRYLTVALAVSVLVLTVGLVRGGFVKFRFMPRVDADYMVAYLTMPQGTPAEQTWAALNQLETAALGLASEVAGQRPPGSPKVIRNIATTVGEQPSAGGRGPHAESSAGGDNAHLGEVNVSLLEGQFRTFSSSELANRWRERAGEIPGAVAVTFSASLFTSGDAISIQLAHRDFPSLLAASGSLKSALAEYPGVKDISDSFLEGKRERSLSLTPEGRNLGLTLADLARQVRAGFYGEEVQRIQRGRDDVRVMVRYPEDARRSLGNIEQMRIRLPDGVEVPFSTVASVQEGRGYAVIDRTDRRRTVTVTADVDEQRANANDINADIRARVLPRLARDHAGLYTSFEGEQREQQQSLSSLTANFAIAMLGIFALLAVPFRSYLQPLIVMSAIPFGLIGAIFGHLIMGLDLSLLSLFGMVALSGVVVNDSLIMIDLINRERAAGTSLDQAIRDSGTRRFRPILLTTLTTFLGLSPMILETSLQARFLIPMAVSLGFGVMFATAITLILIPVLYRILEDIRALFGMREMEVPEWAQGDV
jgi:multidrug efflux pump subunit AcrB